MNRDVLANPKTYRSAEVDVETGSRVNEGNLWYLEVVHVDEIVHVTVYFNIFLLRGQMFAERFGTELLKSAGHFGQFLHHAGNESLQGVRELLAKVYAAVSPNSRP
jgi:hypothetical protein